MAHLRTQHFRRISKATDNTHASSIGNSSSQDRPRRHIHACASFGVSYMFKLDWKSILTSEEDGVSNAKELSDGGGNDRHGDERQERG